MGSFRSLAQGLSSEREKNFKQTCEPAKKLPCPEPTVRSFGGFPKMKRASQVALVVKNPPANTGDLRDVVQPLGLEDPLEEGTATHCSIPAWRIPWTEEPGGLQSKAVQRVGHD